MQRSSETTRVYCPQETASALERWIQAGEELEAKPFDYELIALASGDRVDLPLGFTAEAFSTRHPVPSLGYHLFRSRRHLAPEFEGRAEEEIAELRRQGVEVSVTTEDHTLSYCGDTGVELLEVEPRLFTAGALLLETTYIDAEFESRARRFGHLLLDDLVVHEERFENELIVLHHLSRRHRPSDLRRRVDERLPRLRERIHVWGAD